MHAHARAHTHTRNTSGGVMRYTDQVIEFVGLSCNKAA